MAQAKQGDKVKIHYTGKLEDGTVFDSSEGHDCGCEGECGPLEFTIGAQEVIPGLDRALIGMSVGESKTVTIGMEDAYGPHMDDLVAEIERKDLPADITPEIGQQLEVTQEDGEPFEVVITNATDTHVTLDANHPLAGRTLIFDVKLVEIG